MFRAHSPYSPFFTSGLLSEPLSVPKSDAESAIFLDVVFSDDEQYRSFLSLDLAETQSSRSLSLKRKPSSKHTARSSARPRPKCDAITEDHPRSSLRSGPSPKPIPSMTLPSPPQLSIPTAPPRLPSLPPLPSLELDLSASPPRKLFSHKKHSVRSSIPLSTRIPTRQSSTVSTRTRLRNRATALALLEGRQQPVVAPPPRLRELKNFMSMSDDEDDDGDDILPRSDSEDDPMHFINPSFEPEDIVLPASPSTHSFPPSRVLRPSNSGNLGGRKASQRRVKHKSGKASEWFPLKSFIDLYNENDDDSGTSSWNWRSFIEVSSLS